MADIKTKDAIKSTIKQLDRAAIAGDRMRRAYIQTKDKTETSTHAAESNPEEYASDRITSGAENVTHETVHQAVRAGHKGVEKIKERITRSAENKSEASESSEAPHETREPIKTRETQTEGVRHEPERPQQRQNHAGQPTRESRPSDPIRRNTESPASSRAVEQGRTRAARSAQVRRAETTSRIRANGRQLPRTVEPAKKTVKESARSAGQKTIKTTQKAATKTAQKSVKTAERTAKTAIKTSKEAAKIAEKTAKASAKAAQKAAQAAKATAKAIVTSVKVAVKATIAAVKAIIAAVKGLVAAIAAGGWVAVVVIVILMLIALILCSVFGVFASGEDSGTGLSMPMVVREINEDYDNRLEAEKASVAYDALEMSGSRAVWKEVLAVYSVKVNTDPDAPMEVATMDDIKKQLLKDIFWEMNEISSRSETETSTVIEEADDGNGNIITTEQTETYTTLYIVVSHKTVDEMADQYGFNQEQRDYLTELLRDENNSLWAAVLYGIGYSDDQIVAVALSQIGNVGGYPYWSWYGFNSHVAWCACFVSWCANECGYIDTGVIPKYAGCVWGVQWFKDRGQWMDRSAEPVPGMIIFFDWDNKGDSDQDGQSDHTGIVEKVEDGIVYTVEGNSGDRVAQRQYSVGYYEILGYGVPQY